MIGKIFLTTVAILLLLTGTAGAHHVLVIESSRVKPYMEALRGFSSTFSHELVQFVVSDLKGNELAEYVHEEHPRLIVAIGADALEQVVQFRDIPIVYLMVLNPLDVVHDARNATGVRMRPSPERQLEITRRALSGVRKVGVLHDPTRGSRYVARARESAQAFGLELVTREVHTPREVPEELRRLKGEIDALWLLPDVTVITPDTLEFILLFSSEQQIPIITFSNKYVEKGALMALEVDPYDMGRQAGEMARKILQGADIHSIPRTDARKVTIRINQSVARKFGLAGDLQDRLNAMGRSGP